MLLAEMIWQGAGEAAVHGCRRRHRSGSISMSKAARAGPQGMKLVVANIFRVAALLLLLILLFRTEWLSFMLVPLTNNNAPPVYTQNSLPSQRCRRIWAW